MLSEEEKTKWLDEVRRKESEGYHRHECCPEYIKYLLNIIKPTANDQPVMLSSDDENFTPNTWDNEKKSGCDKCLSHLKDYDEATDEEKIVIEMEMENIGD